MRTAQLVAIVAGSVIFGAGLMGYANHPAPAHDAPASVTVKQGTPNGVYFDYGHYTVKSNDTTVLCNWAASKFSSDTISLSCVNLEPYPHG